MSKEEQVTQLTEHMAKFIAHVGNFQMMLLQNWRSFVIKKTALFPKQSMILCLKIRNWR